MKVNEPDQEGKDHDLLTTSCNLLIAWANGLGMKKYLELEIECDDDTVYTLLITHHGAQAKGKRKPRQLNLDELADYVIPVLRYLIQVKGDTTAPLIIKVSPFWISLVKADESEIAHEGDT